MKNHLNINGIGEISYQEQDILNTLRKCQSGEYRDYKNDNGNTGFVAYAIETLMDNELVTCEESIKKAARNMLIATVIFLLISAMFFVKNILL